MPQKKRTQKKKTTSTSPKIVLVPTTTSTVQSPKGIDNLLHLFIHIVLTVVKYILVFLCGGLVTALVALVIGAYLYVRTVSAQSGVPVEKILATAESIQRTPIVQTDGRKNILLLGIDALSNRDESTILTDTMMILSLNTKTGRIDTFSLPRDLYIASQSSKINAIYQKGQDQKGQGRILAGAVVGDITGLPLHDVMVVDLTTVGKIIDAFGGLDIEVENSFVDYRFPRTDVDVRVVHDDSKLYETVAFTKGKEHMTGDRALRFMRSRHSTDPLEGSDDGRVRRQQRVIAALLAKIKDPTLVKNPDQLGRLYALYMENFEQYLSVNEMGAIGYHFVQEKKFPSFVSHQFGVQGTKDVVAVFYHPERHPSGAWVYLPLDDSWQSIRKQVQQWIQE